MPQSTRKPRITIQRTRSASQPFVFVVRFPKEGWRTRQVLTWKEALFQAGLTPLEPEPTDPMVCRRVFP